MTMSNDKDCSHIKRELVKRIYSNQSIHYVYQCQSCGHVTSASPHKEALEILAGKEPKNYDAELRDNYFRAIYPELPFGN